MKYMEIMNSATRIVLLAMTGALIGLAFTQPTYQGLFENVMIAIISFYFGQKATGITDKGKEGEQALSEAQNTPAKPLVATNDAVIETKEEEGSEAKNNPKVEQLVDVLSKLQ